jgi:HAD superfamily hydrolase (TIGR01458 family)
MQSIRGVLIDLGGVVYQGSAVIPGTLDAIQRLRRSEIPFRFLTNTTSQPLSEVIAKLGSLGIDTRREDVFTPALAARSYIAGRDLDPHFLIAPALEADFRGLPSGSRPAVVVGDARDGFAYASLNEAFRRIDAGAELIALASNRLFIDADNRPSLDVGAFVAALEYATGKQAIVLGKPSAKFFHLAVADMGLEPPEVMMIGDDAEFDVAAAIKAGLAGCLVRTGKWRPGCTEGVEPQPTQEFDDLAAAVDSIVGGGPTTSTGTALPKS